MKRVLSLILVIQVLGLPALACSICGCGGGNVYLGLLPDFHRQFFGIRYQYSAYHTQLLSDPTQFSNNFYNEVELWGGMTIGKKIRLLGFVPYYMNKQVDDDGTMRTNGLGDISLMAQYQVLHLFTPVNKKTLIEQQLWFGGGLKLPSGSFNLNNLDSNTTVADINAQLGTGSTDFLVNGMYSLRINKIIFNATANYKINTTNRNEYRYGNKFSSNFQVQYMIHCGNVRISPNLGIGYEHVASNTLQKKIVEFTGSEVTTAIAGVEFSFNKVGIGMNAQLPVSQNFAEGQTSMGLKAMMHVSFAL
jgi:hypothetical protein